MCITVGWDKKFWETKTCEKIAHDDPEKYD